MIKTIDFWATAVIYLYYGLQKMKQATLNQMRIKKQLAQKANVPKCPTCGSTNVHPISDGKKAVGFLMMGVFSKNFGKSYECDNCKYKW